MLVVGHSVAGRVDFGAPQLEKLELQTSLLKLNERAVRSIWMASDVGNV